MTRTPRPARACHGIDVGRVIVGIADHLVVPLPVDAVGDEVEAQRCRAEQGDFIAVGVDQAGADAPDGLDLSHEIGAFLGSSQPARLRA